MREHKNHNIKGELKRHRRGEKKRCKRRRNQNKRTDGRVKEGRGVTQGRTAKEENGKTKERREA